MFIADRYTVIHSDTIKKGDEMAQKKPNKVPLLLRVDPALKQKVEKLAKRDKRSNSSAGAILLEKGLESETQTNAA